PRRARAAPPPETGETDVVAAMSFLPLTPPGNLSGGRLHRCGTSLAAGRGPGPAHNRRVGVFSDTATPGTRNSPKGSPVPGVDTDAVRSRIGSGEQGADLPGE